MKKIDLHLHTKKSESEPEFSFCLEKLIMYVNVMKIDAIAVTNHNLFDKNQYYEIKKAIPNTVVFPGVEVNLEDGHILVITDIDNVDNFEVNCSKLHKLMSNNGKICYDDFKSIFSDFNQYLFIPHYDKNPKIGHETIVKFGKSIFVGEVSSPKKFIQMIKSDDQLTPVLFSDERITSSINSFRDRQTYVNIDEINLKTLKLSFQDKNKIALSNKSSDLINIDNGNFVISSGLNVILGKRSSGKTYTLNKILEKYGNENIKYIEQFQLIHKDEVQDQNEFDKLLSVEKSGLFEEYIDLFRQALDDYLKTTSIDEDENDITNYLKSLKEFALEQDLRDAYSKCKIYSSSKFQILEDKTLISLIDNVKAILNNNIYNEIVFKYLNKDSLVQLYLELIKIQNEKKIQNKKKKWINEFIDEVKPKLEFESSSIKILDVNFFDILINIEKKKKIIELCSLIKKEKILKEFSIQKFRIKAEVKEYINATDLSNILHIKATYVEAYKKYNSTLEYITELKKITQISQSDYYKFFIKIQYEILNEHELPVSGGERAEFNLLRTIQDARKFDILLIDEPESSFDNVFIYNNVNKLLKDISKEMPVVIVTHNNTIGASIMPDYIIYTQKNIVNGKPIFKTYFGYPQNKMLKNINDEEIPNYIVQMDTLEAGENAYNMRRDNYENLKN